MTKLTISFTLLASSLLWSGCLEYHTTTRVNKDGSLVRTLDIRGDSDRVQGSTYLLPMDTTWSAERSRIDDRKWQLKASRTFSSDRELNEFQQSLSHRVLRSTVTLESSFSWFTTRYAFTEVMHTFNTFQLVPISDFISPSELDAYLKFEISKEGYPTKGDSLALEDASDRYEEWQRRSEFASYFQAFLHGAERASDPRSTPAELGKAKERLYADYLKAVAAKDGNVQPLDRKRLDAWTASASMRPFAGAVAVSKSECDSLIRESEYTQIVLQNSYKASIDMPGTVISSNARSAEGNLLTWEDYISYLYISDFTLKAESQVWNWWAVVVTGVVVLAGPVAVMLRRRLRLQRGF